LTDVHAGCARERSYVGPVVHNQRRTAGTQRRNEFPGGFEQITRRGRLVAVLQPSDTRSGKVSSAIV